MAFRVFKLFGKTELHAKLGLSGAFVTAFTTEEAAEERALALLRNKPPYDKMFRYVEVRLEKPGLYSPTYRLTPDWKHIERAVIYNPEGEVAVVVEDL